MYYLKGFITASFLLIFSLALVANDTRPNIVLITVDDLGMGDLSCYGNRHIETPKLDKLKDESVSFSNFRVTSLCAPTRASLLTGRNFLRTGVSGVHGGRDFIRLEETLISDVLQNAGYATGMWGKWHSGKTAGYMPWDRGYDEAYYSGLYKHENNYGWFNNEYVKHGEWASKVITDYAIDFIERKKNKQPFFAYASYIAPHEPWVAPKEYVDKYLKRGYSERFATLAGMIDEMDHHIGRLLNHISNSEISENTVIIFLSDNGPIANCSIHGKLTEEEWSYRNPLNLRGYKSQNWDNGIKVPLFIKWDKNLEPKVKDELVYVTDIMPTILDIAEANSKAEKIAFDGKSITKLLTEETDKWQSSKFLISKWYPQRAGVQGNMAYQPISAETTKKLVFKDQEIGIVQGDYKLLLNPPGKMVEDIGTKHLFLANINEDPTESNNLINAKKELANLLLDSLSTLYEDVRNSPGIYASPCFQIAMNNEKYSVVNAFAPYKIENNALNINHRLTNVKGKGDAAEYYLNVHQSGTYRIEMELWSEKNAEGIELKLTCQDKSITNKINNQSWQTLGEIELDKGQSILRIEALNEIKQGVVLDRLRRFVFVKSDGDNKSQIPPLPW